MERYERKHARIFFGRSAEIRALYDKITKPESLPVILLFGQSGVGKSSLLEAGLFLKPLNRDGIMEVVTGLTGNAALRERYSLKVEDRLPGIIADNLLADKTTPVAPVLLNAYYESNSPGQRAGRILSAKAGDFEKNKETVRLDEADLEIVEQGKDGMKSLDENEKEFLEVSRKHKLKQERVKKRINRIGASLIIFIIIAAVFSVIQWKVAMSLEVFLKKGYLEELTEDQ